MLPVSRPVRAFGAERGFLGNFIAQVGHCSWAAELEGGRVAGERRGDKSAAIELATSAASNWRTGGDELAAATIRFGRDRRTSQSITWMRRYTTRPAGLGLVGRRAQIVVLSASAAARASSGCPSARRSSVWWMGALG